MKFPYAGLPDFQIWSRAIEDRSAGFVDPQHAGRFTVDRTTRIASAGSCFAQRIAERLRSSGYTYFVAEPGPVWEPAEQRRKRNYGAYSARFGDVYTTLQLVQLARRATGAFAPSEPPWPLKGRFADPLRPRVEPGGFASVAALEADRKQHLAAVRRMLAESEVFVFTLGLTETWVCTADEAALPLCPGAGVGTFDPERYRFRNLSVAENVQYLDEFLQIARTVNPSLRVILTVSPVPLAATMEPRHVAQSTFWSKAVLRVAAEEMRARYDFVDYFPSYEIVVGFDGNDGFEADRRTVSAGAVDRVMHSFFRAYAAPNDERAVAALTEQPVVADIEDDVCNEVYFEKFLAENARAGVAD